MEFQDGAMFVCADASIKGLEEGRHTFFIVQHKFTSQQVILNVVMFNCLVIEYGHGMTLNAAEISHQRSHSVESASENRNGTLSAGLMGKPLKVGFIFSNCFAF